MIIKIRNRNYDFFNKVTLDLRYNSVASTFSFAAFFDPQNPDHKELFKPLSYHRASFEDGGNRLLTGTILNHKFEQQETKSLPVMSGYSLTGVLQDCTIPLDKYPLEFNNMTLEEIATSLIEPFGLRLVVQADEAKEVIAQVTAEPQQKISEFLSEVAAQKNLIISHTAYGSLVITRSRANTKPVTLFDDRNPTVQVSLSVNGQKLHSSVSVSKQADLFNDNAAEVTTENSLVNAFRPLIKTQSSGTDIDTEQAVRNVIANELKNLRVDITLDRWEWDNDGRSQVMTPNNIISLVAPDSYILKPTKLFVDRVVLLDTERDRTAKLSCVVPEVYNGNDPKPIF